jgi:hypothetical protein
VVAVFWLGWLSFSAAWPWAALALELVLFGSVAGALPVGLFIALRRYATPRYIDAHHVERIVLAQRSQGLPEHISSLNIQPMPRTRPPEAHSAPQLPPAGGPTLSAESEWLNWTDQAPHLMVAGRTDSGKTTTVEAVLARRILAGDLVLVVDPHYQAGKWLGATTVGGGRDYAACYQTFDLIRDLLDKRYKAYDAGTLTEQFRRTTIVVDEVPAIITYARSSPRGMSQRVQGMPQDPNRYLDLRNVWLSA